MLPLICPICDEPLSLNGNSYQCNKHHTYDRAKSGYVNLLNVAQKKTKFPGDNKLMALARRDFLNKGYYEPLSKVLNQTCLNHLKDSAVILDAGCGEGYYTARLSDALNNTGICAEVLGIDISKFAVDLAAKRSKNISFAVASTFRLPVAVHSCDMVLNLFAPYCGKETLRVLKPGGIFLMAIPGEEHLWELKKAVYETPYKNEVRDYPLDGFEFLGTQKIETRLNLTNHEDILHLFEMTPYYYKTSKEGQERLAKLEMLSVTASFELLTYESI